MSDFEGCHVTCAITLQWANQQGQSTRTLKYKQATLRLARSNLKDMYIQVLPVSGKASQVVHRFLVKEIKVLNRFMAEGKASIIFQQEKCTVLMSNAPVLNLANFLKTIFFKVTGKETPNKKRPTALELLQAGDNLTDISPVTTAELKKSKEKAMLKTKISNVTTPSPTTMRKRKLAEMSPSTSKIPRAKKLNLGNAEIKVTEEQQRVINSILAGYNVFFTGSAGTGKSFLLKKIISILPPDVTAVTASTGVAACHIGGTTLHRFAGMGLANGSIEECCKRVTNSTASGTWRRIKHLIIDEISMVDADFFSKLEAVARYVKRSEKPFGGIQLVICGDFFQLPPIGKRDEKTKFCFQSEIWSKCVQLNFELKIVHRQKDDKFVRLLNEIRVGKISDEATAILRATSAQKIEKDDIKATRLCSHVNEANEINKTQLENLNGETKVYLAEDSDPRMTETLDRDLPVASKITLRLGAQVMLLKNININSGLTNGARGVVVKFKDGLPVIHFKSSEYYRVKMEKWSIKTANGGVVYRTQIPLKLAWAFSIHKSQGLTLDCVEMNLGRVFDAGQAYVALSRAQSLDSLRVMDFSAQQVWANKDVIRFYERFKRQLFDMEMIPLGRKGSFKR